MEQERCDECLEHEALYDAILNCKAVKLCRRCLSTCNAIELGKSHFDEIPKIAGPSTKEVLFRMSGLDRKEWEGREGARQEAISEITMDYMRVKKKERERDKAMVAEAEKARIAAIAAQRMAEMQQAQQRQEQAKAVACIPDKPKKSVFNFFRRKSCVNETKPAESPAENK